MEFLLAEHKAIKTIYKLGYALDRLDYPGLAKLFYPGRTFHFDIYATLKKPPMDLTVEQFYNLGLQSLGGFDGTQHVITSPLAEITKNGKKASVKVMVYAFHALIEKGAIEGPTARVTWNFELDLSEGEWLITSWRLGAVIPIDREDLMEKAHDNIAAGYERPGIVKPSS